MTLSQIVSQLDAMKGDVSFHRGATVNDGYLLQAVMLHARALEETASMRLGTMMRENSELMNEIVTVSGKRP